MSNESIAKALVDMAKELVREDGTERSAASSYRGDPRWIKAKYSGVAVDGTPFRRGEEVLYWPVGKKIMVGKQAEEAWRDFRSQVADEDFLSGY